MHCPRLYSQAMAVMELLPDVVSLGAAISALEKGGHWRMALERAFGLRQRDAAPASTESLKSVRSLSTRSC